jgi:hypothetical protein
MICFDNKKLLNQLVPRRHNLVYELFVVLVVVSIPQLAVRTLFAWRFVKLKTLL